MQRLAILLILACPAFAQEGTLDILDGETLYENGWLLTAGFEIGRRDDLLEGSRRESDPLNRTLTETSMVLSAHYGLRHDLQLSAILPWVRRELSLDDPAGPDRLGAEGLGDAVAMAKWRFYRWDAPYKALNVALIGGLELPTGSDDERDDGVTLAPELQPGSGSWDPFLGLAATHEPGRWRFNAFALYKLNGRNGDDFSFGDQFFAELAAGNRFWLKPYPGPFMRLDVMLRYRHEARSRVGATLVDDSGGDLLTLGANLAFRPRPELDFQIAVEFPVYESVDGSQLAEGPFVFFVIGYRI